MCYRYRIVVVLILRVNFTISTQGRIKTKLGLMLNRELFSHPAVIEVAAVLLSWRRERDVTVSDTCIPISIRTSRLSL